MKKENNKRTRKSRTPSSEQAEKRMKSFFKKKIINTFCNSGFTYIQTNDKEMKIGLRRVEIDALFIYENIWLICENTTTKPQHIRDHIRTKNETSREIKGNIRSFICELTKLFPEKELILKKYDPKRIKPFYLYITKYEINLSADDRKLFSELCFVQPKTLNYFQWISQCIKYSARYEIFRFLEIKNTDIGTISSSTDSSEIVAPIIYPRSFTGLKNNVRVVSFMMSAEDLLNTCYVLRKDNWLDSIWLYQRLIDKTKIKGIRSFLEKKGEAFYNNIIVGLPDQVRFLDKESLCKTIDQIEELEGDYRLVLPKEFNSICVIDGQHRIFAHYESGVDSDQEKKIRKLRNELHLLVTGLIFPKGMDKEERVRIQSEIFVDINSNAKPVPPNVLLQIKRIQNPIADESIAQLVIERLNKQGVFQNLLQISTLDEGKIKTASIVRFALRYLVTVNPSDGKQSLYTYWNGEKDDLLERKNNAIDAYVDYCDQILRNYFGAVNKNLKEQWDDPSSKLLSVISINGFIIALTRQLSINGVQDFCYYDKVFNGWNCDFSKDGFGYTSSQYRKFSTKILREVFKIEDSVIEKI